MFFIAIKKINLAITKFGAIKNQKLNVKSLLKIRILIFLFGSEWNWHVPAYNRQDCYDIIGKLLFPHILKRQN